MLKDYLLLEVEALLGQISVTRRLRNQGREGPIAVQSSGLIEGCRSQGLNQVCRAAAFIVAGPLVGRVGPGRRPGI